MNFWVALRSIVSVFWIEVLIYVSVYDYPYDYPIWHWACHDPTGWLHEVLYIFIAWHACMWWSIYWQKKLSPGR